MKALLIVDIQNDFLPGGALAVPEGDAILPVVNALQASFPLVVATQDWHPGNHASFASNHKGRNPFETIILDGYEQILWPDHCVQGRPGAAFSDELEQSRIETVFRKGTSPRIDSYSCFFDNRRLKSTGLAGYLKDKKVEQLYIAGLAADFCVGFSALHALEEGFDTYVIEDATRPINQEGFEQMKIKILKKGGHMIHSSALNLKSNHNQEAPFFYEHSPGPGK